MAEDWGLGIEGLRVGGTIRLNVGLRLRVGTYPPPYPPPSLCSEQGRFV